jgi:hypothetical protein
MASCFNHVKFESRYLSLFNHPAPFKEFSCNSYYLAGIHIMTIIRNDEELNCPSMHFSPYHTTNTNRDTRTLPSENIICPLNK